MNSRSYDFSHWGGVLPKVSCLCLTYGRPHLLGEAIESFLRQDYEGEKELIILNDHPEMPLSIPPLAGVRVINAPERFRSLGQKRNALATLATGDLFFPWDDDDISLPWRISVTVEQMKNHHYFKPSTLWWWTGNGVEYHRGVMAHAMAGYSRELFEKVGGYPDINSGEDQGIEQAIRELGYFDTSALREHSSYIYRLNHVDTYHISAHAYGSGWEECASEVAGKYSPGERCILPGWVKDYERILIRGEEVRRGMLEIADGRPLLSICISLKNRSRVPTVGGVLELFPNCLRSICEAAGEEGPIQVIVSDFGSDDCLLSDLLPESTANLRVTLVTAEGNFSRGRGLNLAAAAAESVNLLICDADMLVSQDAIGQGLEILSKGLAWFPIIRNLLPDGTPGGWESDGFGISFVNKAVFFKAGGLPEFESWGGEDNVFRDRIGELTEVARSQCEGLKHQWHPDSLRDLEYRHPRRFDFDTRDAAIHTMAYAGQDVDLRAFKANHPHWSGLVHLKSNGLFYRSGSDTGSYEIGADGRLTLKWDDWPPETLDWLEREQAYVGATGFRLTELIPVDRSQPKGEAGFQTELVATVEPIATALPAAKAKMGTIAVMTSYAEQGFPHLKRFLKSNPGIPIHLINGPALIDWERRDEWRNCDRTIRRWWLEQGMDLDFERVVFIEHDVVFDADLSEVFPAGHFFARDVHVPGKSDWYWLHEVPKLPDAIRSHATGISPLAVIVLSRECLRAAMNHPLAEELYAADLYCELRLSTLASACGYVPVAHTEALLNVDWQPVTSGPGTGVWHSVKA